MKVGVELFSNALNCRFTCTFAMVSVKERGFDQGDKKVKKCKKVSMCKRDYGFVRVLWWL